MRHTASPTRLTLCRRMLRLLALASACPLACFAQSNPPAPATQQILVADFNNDGIPDALVLTPSTPTAFLALGSTTLGTFSTASYIVYPGATTANCGTGSTVATTIGDFNGDTYPDIAFYCLGPSGMSVAGVLLNKGDGTFTTGTSPAELVGTTLFAGDFNHDGKVDLVGVGPVAYGSSQSVISFLPGNGDGTFGTAVYSLLPAATAYSSVIAADLRGNGYPDIAAGNFSGSGALSVDVYGNNTDGTFGIATGPLSGSTAGSIATTPNLSAPVGTAPASTDTQLLFGNFFGTGVNDLAVVDTGTGAPGIFLLQNLSTSTVYSFSAATKTAVDGIQSAAAANFTGSGSSLQPSDLIVSNGTALSVLDNDGTGTFGTNFTALSLPGNPVGYSAADANFDGYADVYQLVTTQTGRSLSVALLSGTATATSMPVLLAAGTQPISAVWAGNQNFTGSNASGTVVVEGLLNATTTTLASALNPAPLGTPVPLTALVTPSAATSLVPTGQVTFMDGQTSLGQAAVDGTGTATFSISTLTVGAHALTAAYSGDANFSPSTSQPLTEQITTAAPDIVLSGPPSSAPGQQPALNFQLVNPYPTALDGTFTLTFTSSVSGRADDPSVQFSSGGRTLTFTIPANSVATPQVLLQSGTLAGTITVSLDLKTGGVDVTPADLQPVVITVPPSPPLITSVTPSTTADGNLSVVVNGLSNTLEVSQATFHFNAAKGDTITDPDITVDVPTPFAQWFGSAGSASFGSTFGYTQLFLLSGGGAKITSVDVTLTNSVGTSTTVTGTTATSP